MANRPEKLAFETAKEIVVASMTNTQHCINKESGESVADFFETVYNKLLEITASSENE